GPPLPIAPYDPNANAISPSVTANDAAPIAGSDLFPLLSNAQTAIGSSSYRIVAGANITSANPLALQPLAIFADSTATALAGHGNVPLSGATKPGTAFVPTIVRPGTGSIDVAAARDVVMTDTLAPGVIYTAGRASPALPDPGFTAQQPLLPDDGTVVPV